VVFDENNNEIKMTEKERKVKERALADFLKKKCS